MGISIPYLGHGIGLRTRHFPDLWEGAAKVDWFEAISENFMVRGGRPLAALEKARAIAPLVLHGVSLSLGSTDALNEAYVDALQTLIQRFEPAWVSDHLCWGSIGGHYAHDLLPLPYTEEALELVVRNIQKVQEILKRRILIENVASYLTYSHSVMPEWEFVAEIAKRADCGILLDVNNIYVSAYNHRFSPHMYIENVPSDRVGQIHLAGHSNKETYLLDTHDGPVIDPVWDLYRFAVRCCGRVSTLVEWDDRIPEFAVVKAQAERARALATEELRLLYARSA